MNSRRLEPGGLPKEERRTRRERHLLALAGGGYRGLFSAEVLAAVEEEAHAVLADRFDMIAGTSIGGILAIGLGCGIRARDLAAFMREHGPAIFKPRTLSFAGLSRSRYDSSGLRRAVVTILGRPLAQRPFAEISVPLVVSAVDEGTGTPHLFRSGPAAGGTGDRISTLDVALATAAAPTYFPPHRIGERVYVDGGLVAAAPDLVVLTEACRLFASRLEDCHLLSIGTAASPRAGGVGGDSGGFAWVARHKIVDLIMTAQEALATDQVRCLQPGTFLRLNAVPAEPIGLDDISPKASEQLVALAKRAVEEVRQVHAQEWRRFLSHSISVRMPL